MITLQLSPGDIEKVRFAYSPLIELSNSFKVFQRPELYPLYQPWVATAQQALDHTSLPFMRAVILKHSYIADFLTPTPTKMNASIESEFDRIRETPDTVIRKNVEHVMALDGITPERQMLLQHPREMLECLIEELRFYWQQTLEPQWQQLSSVLEHDVLFRARTFALYGIDTMFMELAEEVDYHQGAIRVHKGQKQRPHMPPIYHLKGTGIQLVPSAFASCSGSWQVEDYWLPMLIYQTRGLGLWKGDASASEPTEALQLTLGTSRARLLTTLAEPAHTRDLAQRLNLTAGAVSQQLGRLSQAGLIESYRSGSKVFYRLSQRGERLLDAFTA